MATFASAAIARIVVPYAIAVSAVVALFLTAMRRRFGAKGGGSGAALLFLLGTSQFWPAQRAPYQLADSVVISQPQEKVFASMRRLELPLESRTPLWMRWLLPRPLHISGGGTDVGAKRRVVFENGVLLATVTSVDVPHRFGLKLEVEESGREFFDHWGTFGDSEFRFEALSPKRTRVVHATWFQPDLRMHRFFSPIEMYLGHALQSALLGAYAEALEENELSNVRVSAAR